MDTTTTIRIANDSIIIREYMEKTSMDRQRQMCLGHIKQQSDVTTSGWRKAHAFTWKIPKWAAN